MLIILIFYFLQKLFINAFNIQKYLLKYLFDTFNNVKIYYLVLIVDKSSL